MITKKKARRGRPPKSQTVKKQVCEYIAAGKTLRQIIELPGMPTATTITRWRQIDDEFSSQYARARATQTDILIEDIEELTRDIYIQSQEAYQDEDTLNKPPPPRVTHEMISALRLLVDTRKWCASKLSKVYGDKVSTEEQGERTITIVIDSDDAKA